MQLDRKRHLLGIIEQELEQKRLQVERAKKSAKERTEETIGSWSAGGDRAHAENALELAKLALIQIEKLKERLETYPESIPDKAEPICHIRTTDKEFYFVEESIRLPGVLLVGRNSPLGQAIIGKRAGDKFSLLGKKHQILSIS